MINSLFYKYIFFVICTTFSLNANAERFGSALAEKDYLNAFTNDGKTYLAKIDQVQLLIDEYSKKKFNKDVMEKEEYLNEMLQSKLMEQFKATQILFWSLNMALDVERRDKLKLASGFSLICSTLRASDYSGAGKTRVDDWETVMIEYGNQLKFNSREKKIIEESIQGYRKSKVTTFNLCNRVSKVESWDN